MDGEELRACLETLECVEKRNRELFELKIAEGRQKDVRAKLAALENDVCAAKIIPTQSVSLTAKRYGPNIIFKPLFNGLTKSKLGCFRYV